nr:hypothetical protein [Lysobacter lactosilyticus]
MPRSTLSWRASPSSFRGGWTYASPVSITSQHGQSSTPRTRPVRTQKPFATTSIDIANLKVGPHKVKISLVDANHTVFQEIVQDFVITGELEHKH